ncbi:triose-phosphate isomerase [Paraglaciecola aquimarina]|uniref:Triosephosphate isomerase n=1 Tax=Paraglaciecola aquimarina TaxID=1235557 RepID=A0ABU3SZL7_9ALTE|nr:triose-phosphate isomerase [Paraglaciecola aquimarina]MDU0355455.1 triose-phosphate isomerase [Paraglaciecola aquimarina]
MQANKRRSLVVGNWKMNGDRSLVEKIQSQFSQASLANMDWAICPPAAYLGLFDSKTPLGAQNVSQFDSGAHTGELSVSIVKDLGCQYVIVGHSERREDNFESDEVVALKVEKILAAGLTPILCVGEPESVRDAGTVFEYLTKQLDAVVTLVGISAFANIVLAYEPIWAIGTGKTASPAQAQDVHGFIRGYLANLDSNIAAGTTILYGGSVKGSNAKELFSQADVDGGLIGGASLNPEDFLSICLAANL